MTVWVERMNDRIIGICYAISCEYHDAYIYTGRNITEAVKNYEADRHVKVNKIVEVK